MVFKNTSTTYGLITKSFHWLMALMIFVMMGVGLYMKGLPNEPFKSQVYGLHKSVGITLLALFFARLSWRVINIQPPLAKTIVAWQRGLAHLVHGCLYVCMFLMPLSGWAMSSAAGFPVSFFGWMTVPPLLDKNEKWIGFFKDVHEYTAYILIALLILHVLAAMVHHFFYKDNVLKHMV